MNIFIKCPQCGSPNRIDGIPVERVDLAVFRGSAHRVKCKTCQARMDTMTAYVGEEVNSKIERREDPKY